MTAGPGQGRFESRIDRGAVGRQAIPPPTRRLMVTIMLFAMFVGTLIFIAAFPVSVTN